jgi:antitoxin PrlF
MQMGTTLTKKGQVTIPKRVRDALGLKPKGAIYLRRAAGTPAREPDGIDRATGSADYKWGSTAEYMKFIRGDDYEINGD